MNDPVKAKIIELVPEIVELRAGCFVHAKRYGLPETDGTLIQRVIGGEWVLHSEQFGVFGHFRDEDLTILGRPITLADVLRAMKGNVGKYVAVSFGGDFLTREYGADSWIMSVETWNLTTDYEGQTAEVKAFIGKLLNV